MKFNKKKLTAMGCYMSHDYAQADYNENNELFFFYLNWDSIWRFLGFPGGRFVVRGLKKG